MREFIEFSMDVKQGRVSIFYQFKSIEKFSFATHSFGTPTTISITKGLYSSSTFFAGQSINIQHIFIFLRILLFLNFKQMTNFWNSSFHMDKELKLKYKVTNISSTCFTILNLDSICTTRLV